MKIMLTSSLGGSTKENGISVPSILIQRNGLLDNLKSIWITESNVLIICADPSDHEKNGRSNRPLYERWIRGLGLTDINIFPHFQSLKDDYLDGMCLIEDKCKHLRPNHL